MKTPLCKKRCNECKKVIDSGRYCKECIDGLKPEIIKEFNCSNCKTKSELSMYVNHNGVSMMCCKNCIAMFNDLKSKAQVDQILNILSSIKDGELVQEDYDKIIDRLYELTGDKTYFGESWNYVKQWIFKKWPRDIGLYE